MVRLLSDLSFACRSLRKNPLFTTVAVLSLALGIGANTAIFSLLDQILLRLLPVKNPRELVLFTMRGQHYGSNWGYNAISYPMYRDFQDHNEVFSEMFARYLFFPSIIIDGAADRIQAELVSGTYFPSLGVGAAIGRTFTPDDDRTPSGHPLAIISYNFWETHFGKNPNVLGRKILVNSVPLTIIGVAQSGFNGLDLEFATEVFVPLMMQPDLKVGRPDFLKDRRTRWVNAFGRVKPGVPVERAKASLQRFMHSMLEMEVREPAFRNASDIVRRQFLQCYMDLVPGSQGRGFVRERLQAPLWVLMAITGTVLLIACANLANLLLARAAGREREIAVRLAVGASRRRIVQQLLTESLLLAVLGGALGAALALGADRILLAAFVPSRLDGLKISAALDFRVLLFTVGVTAATGLLFGLLPALRATKPDLAPTLKENARAVVSGGSILLRKTLVVSQVTLSLLLLVGAGLFMKSLSNLRNLGPGFPVERLIAFDINPPNAGYTADQGKQFYRRLEDNLRAIPGVRAAGLAGIRILQNNESDNWVTIEGYTPRPGDRPDAFMNWIGPGYFDTLGVPIVAGRDFTRQDSEEVLHSPPNNWVPTKVIVNEAFVKRYFHGRDAIGRHIGFGIDPGTKTDMEIIGVVKDVKYLNLRSDVPDQAFSPYLSIRFPIGMTVFVRTEGDPAAMFKLLRAKVREMDASLPVTGMGAVQDDINDTLVTERLTANLSAVFGCLATLLAMVGLYGVMAYSVARRTKEIGIRMALGAVESSVVWMVMREVLILVVLGVAVALPAALALTRLVRAQLYGTAPNDPSIMAIATAGLALVASAAGYIPALRASRVNPIRALRYE
jgi:predicted permease